MHSGGRPNIYTISSEHGFADALAAAVIEKYHDDAFGCARVTLILPSSRAQRIVTEAFIRQQGALGRSGLLMPRMVGIGDLDIDERVGSIFDSVDSADIPAAIDHRLRVLHLTRLISEEMGADAPVGASLFRHAEETARLIDRLLIEEITPHDLIGERVITLVGDLAAHWHDSLRSFMRVYARWSHFLESENLVDAAVRRNRLFGSLAAQWQAHPPAHPIIAAGITSAAPAIARLLRVIAFLEHGSVVLPGLDTQMTDEVWAEIGDAGGSDAADADDRGGRDIPSHPQYHLKLLLNRMGINRAEVGDWCKSEPTKVDRARAIEALFLPPQASRVWGERSTAQRQIPGLRLVEAANQEEEAQAVALLVRHALDQEERRAIVVTPDRGLARRVIYHLRRWGIHVDDSAGMPLTQSPAGRLLLLIAECVAQNFDPLSCIAMLSHPLVKGDGQRGEWLRKVRALDFALRGPLERRGWEAITHTAQKICGAEWWQTIEAITAPLRDLDGEVPLADVVKALAECAEHLSQSQVWAREDGRALSAMVAELADNASRAQTVIKVHDVQHILRDMLNNIPVRAAWGGHPRVAIYGLLESRMSRADLVICAGMNEGVWPAVASGEKLLAPGILRLLGVPSGDFRIGLSAHDLAQAMGAENVVLTRALRDGSGPTIASRFILRIRAMLGEELVAHYQDDDVIALARTLDHAPPALSYRRPAPAPDNALRPRRISVTALDRLKSDPFHYYAAHILRLNELDNIDSIPKPNWLGTMAHSILEQWHKNGGDIAQIADDELRKLQSHPIVRVFWRPRLVAALRWVESVIADTPERRIAAIEDTGEWTYRGITINGKVDRVDDGPEGLTIVDYKTGAAPRSTQVRAGYAMQLGTIALILREGGFPRLSGKDVCGFEYWSLGKNAQSVTGFGRISSPLSARKKDDRLEPQEFMDKAKDSLDAAIDRWILGDEAYTARLNPDADSFTTYDQLMRLEEWLGGDE